VFFALFAVLFVGFVHFVYFVHSALTGFKEKIMPFISEQSVKQALELAKAGMGMSSGSMVNSPDQVAKFLEIVSAKIEALMNPPKP